MLLLPLAGNFSPGEIVVSGWPHRHPVPLAGLHRVLVPRDVVHQVQRAPLVIVGVVVAVSQGLVTEKKEGVSGVFR